jgi:hypothetical protein
VLVQLGARKRCASAPAQQTVAVEPACNLSAGKVDSGNGLELKGEARVSVVCSSFGAVGEALFAGTFY